MSLVFPKASLPPSTKTPAQVSRGGPGAVGHHGDAGASPKVPPATIWGGRLRRAPRFCLVLLALFLSNI